MKNTFEKISSFEFNSLDLNQMSKIKGGLASDDRTYKVYTSDCNCTDCDVTKDTDPCE